MSIVASTISVANSTQLGGQQTASQTVALADGGYVTAWTTDQGTLKDVVFQRFDAAGERVGGPVTANATLSGNQVLTDIVATGDGSFTLAWTAGTTVTTRSFDGATGAAVSGEAVLTVAGNSATGAQIVATDSGEYKVITTSVSAGATVIEQAVFTTAGVAVTAKSTITSSAPVDGSAVEVVDGNVAGTQLILLSGGRVVSSANGSIRDFGNADDILKMQNGFHVLADRDALGAMLVGLFGTSGNMNSYSSTDGQVVANPASDAPANPSVYDLALVNLGNGRVMVAWVADTGVNATSGVESDGIYAAVYDTNSGAFVDGGAFLIKDFGAETVLDLSTIKLEADLLTDGRVALSWSSNNGLSGSDISTTILDPRYGSDGSLTQAGTSGDDLMGGTGSDDVLSGGLGDDAIAGMKGDDMLTGGDGNDVIYGNDGNDVIYGGVGNDLLAGGDGINTLHGDDGNDKIVSGAGDDTITGGAGNDRIGAGEGFNIIDGGEGIDTLFLTNSGSTYVDLDDLNSPVGDMTDFLANDDLIVGIENLSGSDASSIWRAIPV